MALNPFEFEDPAWLATAQSAYRTCILAVANGAQSYSLNGVNVNRATLDAAKETLGQITLAIRLQSGTAVRVAHPIVRPLFPSCQ